MMSIYCAECGNRVSSWSSYSTYTDGTEILEAHWLCKCGHRGTRVIITIDVQGDIL